MAYNRPPTTVKAGRALIQNPPPTPLDPAGVIELTIDANIATKDSLGVVQIGNGIDVTPEGIISVNGGGSRNCVTRYVNANYTATVDDYYIGVIAPSVTKTVKITLPSAGAVCQIIVIKDQRGSGGFKILIEPAPGEDLEGTSQQIELQQPYESVTLLGQNSAWWVIANVQ